MADRPPTIDQFDRVDDADDAESPPGAPPETPRWEIGFYVAGIALIVCFVALHLAGGGFRHHLGP